VLESFLRTSHDSLYLTAGTGPLDQETGETGLLSPRIPSSFHPLTFTAHESGSSLKEQFEYQANRVADQIAVQETNGSLSFAQLNRAANRIANAILALRGDREEPIALLLENHVPLILAILGVLKSGKFYVPLDPLLPSSRLAAILQDSQAGLVLTNSRNRALAAGIHGMALIDIDALDHAASEQDPGVPVRPDSPCWILYTSGSTGPPKGVVQTNCNVLHFIRNYVTGLRLCAEDRVSLLFSCGVNLGSHLLLTALLNGLPILPFDVKQQGVARLADWLHRERITIFTSVPTVFRRFVHALNDHAFPHLRIVQLGGEPALMKDFESFTKHFSEECVLVNRLGSTETGTIRWCFLDRTSTFDSNIVPVGYPVDDNEVIIFDDDGRPAGANQIGEIVVRSRYLSPGYWHRPDLTSRYFLPDPEQSEKRLYLSGDLGFMKRDGCLFFMGRKDFQVKIRGYRIEIPEIETSLLRSPQVREAVVVAQDDPSGEKRLVAYCVTAGGRLDVTSLRRALAETLPDYMIPSVFVPMKTLPQTPNGKLDRRALPAPGRQRPELAVAFEPPATPVEEVLAAAWTDVLGIDPVGIHDGFLELGGHSIHATQIVSRVASIFGMELPLRTIFEDMTIHRLASRISDLKAG
jgi:amino acid adenylation domain-containing protein